NLRSLKGLVQFQYIIKPEYVTDIDSQTLIHLALLNDPKAVIQAIDAVNYYYFHTLNNPSHRSDKFWKNFIEHFEYVDTLFHKLGSLLTFVNEFVQEFYGNLYEKLEKLNGIKRNTDRHDVLFIKYQNLNNAQGLNSRTMFFKLKKKQIPISPSLTDCRR
ncbi:31_t:CDS:2, partial [Scutellospora calospora]